MKIPTLVRYLVGEQRPNTGADVPAIVVKVKNAETGIVDLQVFHQRCHGSYIMYDVEPGSTAGTWHREGE